MATFSRSELLASHPPDVLELLFVVLLVLIDEDADLRIAATENFGRAHQGVTRGKRRIAEDFPEEILFADELDGAGVVQHAGDFPPRP